ncbi:hypothetical protein EDB89DRAFT_1956400, partial [Lactarius sanguifluus]
CRRYTNPFPSCPYHSTLRQTRPFRPVRRYRKDLPDSRQSAQTHSFSKSHHPSLRQSLNNRKNFRRFTKLRQRSRHVRVFSTLHPRFDSSVLPLVSASHSHSLSRHSWVRYSPTFRQPLPTHASSGASKTSTTFGSTTSMPQVATRSRIGSDTGSTRPAAHASFSTQVAQLQVQVSSYCRHTKTFASASRRHASASSPRAAPPFSLPF